MGSRIRHFDPISVLLTISGLFLLDFVQLMWDIAMDFNGQVQKDYSNFLQNFKDLDRCGRLG